MVLGVIRQQAITWNNVGPDLCHYMASQGHIELNSILTFQFQYSVCLPPLWQTVILYSVTRRMVAIVTAFQKLLGYDIRLETFWLASAVHKVDMIIIHWHLYGLFPHWADTFLVNSFTAGRCPCDFIHANLISNTAWQYDILRIKSTLPLP